MARCGCSSSTACNCFLEAGSGVTVEGSGSMANPWVISTDGNATTVDDTDTVDMDITGTGTAGDPYIITSTVKVDPAAGNLIEVTPNGLRVDCDAIADECGSQVITVDDTDSVDLTLAGDVLTADVRLADDNLIEETTDGLLVSCDNVRTCFTNGNGLDYDPVTGQFEACVSTDANNVLTFGADNCLYVPSGAASVDTDCGLLGDGTGGDPLRVAVQGGAWPFGDCDQDANGGSIYCNPNTGALHTDPPKSAAIFNGAGGFSVPAENVPNVETVVDSAEIELINPSECHPAVALVVWEADLQFQPAGNTQIEMSMNGDGMVQFRQNGGTVDQVAWQQGRAQRFNLLPGETLPVVLPISIIENNGGGSTWSRVQWRIHAIVVNV